MGKQFVNDQHLVSQYIKGDESALATIVERHKQKVFNFIMKYVKEKGKAEDIFQETFFKAISSLKKGKYKEQGRFLPWVLCIAHNIIINDLSAKKKNKTICILKNKKGKEVNIFNVLVLPEQILEVNVIKIYKRKKLRNMIRCLNLEQRQVIILHHYFGMTFREIAEKMDVSINTALGRMHYAMINLKKIKQEQEIDFDEEAILSKQIFNKKEMFFNSRTINY